MFIAPVLELPIPRGLAGPGMLADKIVKRWQDHLPLYRLEGMYARDGLELARSTMCGWHAALADVVRPLVAAMRVDAFKQPYLCTDATGVLVQQKERCRTGHFWVLVAPDRHVLFEYTPQHSSDAVDDVLSGYEGFLVADAHIVYDHLYARGDVVEVNCWAHTRRYSFKALESDPERSTAIACSTVSPSSRWPDGHTTRNLASPAAPSPTTSTRFRTRSVPALTHQRCTVSNRSPSSVATCL